MKHEGRKKEPTPYEKKNENQSKSKNQYKKEETINHIGAK